MKIGIIGGSGLDDPNILHNAKDENISTPYGEPSSFKTGTIEGLPVMLIGRHGKQHTIPPSQVNYRANIQALKQKECTHIIATTAVGSLREEIKRKDFVILDQFIDHTRKRNNTFYDSFEPHKPMHVSMAQPFDNYLRDVLIDSCKKLNLNYHPTGTVVTIEGPRFSTTAESHMFRSWNADVINMSIATEAALANEALIPYAAIAMSTDYDCWKKDEEPVTWEAVLKTFEENVHNVTNLLVNSIKNLKE